METTVKHDLSDRQVEILKLLVKGFSSKRIGEELGITEMTVQTHRRNMLRKLKMSNIEMVTWAVRNGI